MISNERPSPYGSRPHGDRPHGDRPSGPPKPPVNEETLKSAKIQIERKTFVLALKENPRGRFLRITEDVGGRRDTVIIPAPGLEEFQKVLDEMVKASAETPPKADVAKRFSPRHLPAWLERHAFAEVRFRCFTRGASPHSVSRS